jgi:hypothetical protein
MAVAFRTNLSAMQEQFAALGPVRNVTFVRISPTGADAVRTTLSQLERVMGIEPTLSAWEAEVLPLNYTRKSGSYGLLSAG